MLPTSFRAVLVGSLLGAVCCVRLAAAAAAPEIRIESWSAAWSTGDDFAAGALPDGDPGEVELYEAPCGGVDDAAKAAGRVRLAGPGAACNGTVALMPRVLLGPTYRLLARFRLISAPPPVALGISTGTSDFSQRRDLVVERGALLGPGTDAVGISLYTQNEPAVERVLLSPSAAAYLAATPVLELELSTALNGSGGSDPHGRYRVCPVAGCSAQAPFVDLDDVAGPIAGEISGSDLWVVNFFADGAAFAVDLLDWSLDNDVADSFDAPLNPRVQYVPRCASLHIEDGALMAMPVDPAACDGSLAGTSVQAPGEATAQATFRWSMPEPCTAGVGIGLAADPAASPDGDGFFAYLVRGPLPGVGDDALAIVVEDESNDSAAAGWIELLVLSATPALPAPADSIELRVEAARDGATGPLLPHAMVRTCLGSDCTGAPFVDLEPYSFPQDDPDRRFCGSLAAELARPADGGAIDPNASLVPVLLFAPEPNALIADGWVLAAIALLRRARLTARRESPPRGSCAVPRLRDAESRRGAAGSSRLSR